MKAAAAHDSALNHPPHPSSSGYSTRIRKPKRKDIMPTAAAASHRSRTRSVDHRDRDRSSSKPSSPAQPPSSSANNTPPSTPTSGPPSASAAAQSSSANNPNNNNNSTSNASTPQSPSTSAAPQPHSSSSAAAALASTGTTTAGPADADVDADPDADAADADADVDADAASSSPPPPNSSSSSRHNAPHVWRPADVRALGRAVHARRTRPAASALSPFTDAADLPSQLAAKGLVAVRRQLATVSDAHDRAHASFAPPADRTPSVLAALSSDLAFLAAQGAERADAQAKLARARADRLAAEQTRDRLAADTRQLAEQIARERARRAAVVQRKAELERANDDARRSVDGLRDQFDGLRAKFEKARNNELDVRRRLDRMRLKVAALRGEMVVPTVDRIAAAKHVRWMGNFGPDLSNTEPRPTPPERVAAANAAKAEAKAKARLKAEEEHVAMDIDASGAAEDGEDAKERDDVPLSKRAKLAARAAAAAREDAVDEREEQDEEDDDDDDDDDLEIDLDAQGMELRLLKNRLAMVETEARDWQGTLDAERNKVVLVMRGKAQLDAAMAHRKNWTTGKTAALNSAMRHATMDTRSAPRVRSAVKASMAIASASLRRIEGPIRKGRKMSKPERSLVGES